jgi:hypothetical protein
MARPSPERYVDLYYNIVRPEVECVIQTRDQAKTAIKGIRRVQRQLESLFVSVSRAELRQKEGSAPTASGFILTMLDGPMSVLSYCAAIGISEDRLHRYDTISKGINESVVRCQHFIEQLEGFIDAGSDGPGLEFGLPESVARSIQLFDPAAGEKGQGLEDAIIEVLQTGGPRGRTAKDIAYRLRKEGYLGITKSEVNRCLHRSDADIEKTEESPPRWRFI